MQVLVTKNNVVDLLSKGKVIVLSHVYKSKGKKYWVLCKPIDIVLSNGHAITIPEDYVTDLSSVPCWLWGFPFFLPPFGNFLLAAIIHDYLYTHRPFKGDFNFGRRQWADKEMLYWSNLLNTKASNYVRYWGVKYFGWIVWNKNTKFGGGY